MGRGLNHERNQGQDEDPPGSDEDEAPETPTDEPQPVPVVRILRRNQFRFRTWSERGDGRLLTRVGT